MLQTENNYAFIDSQNLNLGVQELGWRLDFNKFRIFLREKYSVSKAYLFIGYIPWNSCLYEALKSYDYLLIFKQAVINEAGVIKGNIDAELVLQAMVEYQNYEKAIIISGDGDFACLVRYLNENQKMKNVIVPNQNKYSGLLKQASEGKINFLSDARVLLEDTNIKSPT
jgi:uncharacterized LabA/DUF88 family protein